MVVFQIPPESPLGLIWMHPPLYCVEGPASAHAASSQTRGFECLKDPDEWKERKRGRRLLLGHRMYDDHERQLKIWTTERNGSTQRRLMSLECWPILPNAEHAENERELTASVQSSSRWILPTSCFKVSGGGSRLHRCINVANSRVFLDIIWNCTNPARREEGVSPSPRIGGPGVLPPGNFWNLRRNLVHFGDKLTVFQFSTFVNKTSP